MLQNIQNFSTKPTVNICFKSNLDKHFFQIIDKLQKMGYNVSNLSQNEILSLYEKIIKTGKIKFSPVRTTNCQNVYSSSSTEKTNFRIKNLETFGYNIPKTYSDAEQKCQEIIENTVYHLPHGKSIGPFRKKE